MKLNFLTNNFLFLIVEISKQTCPVLSLINKLKNRKNQRYKYEDNESDSVYKPYKLFINSEVN
jgi:hypothetical protein